MRYLLCGAMLWIIATPALAETTLPANALVCIPDGKIEEAERAATKGDERWFKTLAGCMITKRPLRAERISCDGRYCQVRIFPPDYAAFKAYTLRRYM